MNLFLINIKKNFSSTFLIFLFLPVILNSCSTSGLYTKGTLKESKFCYPDNPVYREDSSFAPIEDLSAFLKEDTFLLQEFSRHDLQLANAIGILILLKELQIQEKSVVIHPSIENDVKLLKTRQLIITKLMAAASSVSSIAAELDCEGERADQLGSYMDDKQNQITKRLTAASIGLGAIAGISTTVLNPGAGYYALGVGGGAASAAFALVTLYPNKKIQFFHTRNLLADIWAEKSKSTIYPSFIWHILINSSFNTGYDYSVCHSVKKGWEKFGHLGKSGSKEQRRRIELFFGEGGKYSADDLHTRADMINQLQSVIRLINQDLQSLIMVVSK